MASSPRRLGGLRANTAAAAAPNEGSRREVATAPGEVEAGNAAEAEAPLLPSGPSVQALGALGARLRAVPLWAAGALAAALAVGGAAACVAAAGQGGCAGQGCSPGRDLLMGLFPGGTTVTSTSTATTTTTSTMTTTVTSTRTTTTTVTLGADSLFCFALVMPAGYEIEMIRWLHEQQKSLFLCDRYAVYSNETLSLGGLKNRIVETSLEAPIGGAWNTALNTPIFQKLWMQVIHDKQYKEAGWTVKVDVDAVFLPNRLRELVGGDDYKDAQEGQGHFLNNCEVKGSLHGPIEVLSRKALEVYGGKYTECDQSWQQEDVFLRMCLVSSGVKEHFDFVVMSEQWCNDDWESCTTRHITFHPFKSVDSYQDCLSQAEGEGQGNWWV